MDVDVLVPTRDRPAELATTLAGLAAQDGLRFRVILSGHAGRPIGLAALAMIRALRRQGIPVKTLSGRSCPGLAEQRDSLLQEADAPYVLFLNDDIWLKTGALHQLYTAISTLECGLVSYADVPGCALFDRAALESGGSWAHHAGESIVSHQVTEQFGSVGIRPSGAVHLESLVALSGEWTEIRDVTYGVASTHQTRTPMT
ncbi:MAG: glycosyltransferase family A protein [Kibdelosporangium sp.]